MGEEAFHAFADGMILGNNTVYVPGGEATVTCGGRSLNSSAFQKLGYDATTTFIADMPSNETIINWARKLLELGPTPAQHVV